MIFLFFWLVPVAIVILIKFIDWVQSKRTAPPPADKEQSEDVPYYVFDKLTAHENRLDTLINKLSYLEEQETIALQLDKQADVIKLSNQIATCKIQIAQEEERIYKICEKWSL